LISANFENLFFLDHCKRRSENTKHTFDNNKDLALDWGGQYNGLPAFF